MDISFDRRFRGPPESANGGYASGRLAAPISGPATVRLMAPPPLDTPLSLRQDPDGFVLEHDRIVIGHARPGKLELAVPESPGLDAARAASTRFAWRDDHLYPGCFVCGTDRSAGDGLQIFAGPLADGGGVAAPWTPGPDLDDGRGRVRPEFIWSALDCPGAFTFQPAAGNAMLLGEITADVEQPVDIGEPLLAFGWHLGSEGRKHFVGTAIFGTDGGCRARARATWIEIPIRPGAP